MEIDLVSIHFWIIHILIIFGFIGGTFYRVSEILKGDLIVEGKPIKSRWSKVWFLIRRFARILFSRKLGKLISVCILDSMVHIRLFSRNKLKWFTHTLIFWGLAVLFLLSILSGLAVEIVPAFGYQEGSCGFIDALADKDYWWTAFLNEWLNVIVLLGIILAFAMGFISKRDRGLFLFNDIFLIIFIFLILISGWFTEAFRYIIEQTPEHIAKVGFLGYYLGRLLKFIFPGIEAGQWLTTYKVFWHIHVSIIWVSFLYIPFSKFSHILLSPLAVVVNKFVKINYQENNNQDE